MLFWSYYCQCILQQFDTRTILWRRQAQWPAHVHNLHRHQGCSGSLQPADLHQTVAFALSGTNQLIVVIFLFSSSQMAKFRWFVLTVTIFFWLIKNMLALNGVPDDRVAFYGGSVELADYCPYNQEFEWRNSSVDQSVHTSHINHGWYGTKINIIN